MHTIIRASRRPFSSVSTAVATLIVLPVLAACSESSARETRTAIAYAAPMRLGDGTARTYVVRDSRGVPTSLGVELTESALRNLPATPVFLNLPFPKEAGSQYTFNMLHWNPAGHMPDHVYTVPHFDFHFYMANEDSVMAIPGGADSVVANSRFLPTDYIAPGNEAIQMMGVHWVDKTSGEFNGKTFDQTFIWGFYRGKHLFIEPMITKAFLESTSSFTMELKQPELVQRAGLYPKRYSIRHDTVAKVYRITLDELTPRITTDTAAVHASAQSIVEKPEFPPPPYEPQAPAVEKNLKKFDSLDFDVFSNQKWDRLGESHAKDIVVTWPDGHETKGIEKHIDDLKALFVYAPDISLKVHPIRFGSGSWTTATGVMTGTFSKAMPLPGGKSIPPTGKRFAISMATIGHWQNGTMDHEWLFWDAQDFMKQLGLAQ